MTTTTPHGQVPEALIDLIDAYAETRHRCGGIYNARTEVARKAVIEALSGVQALSAAPANHNASRALQGLDFIMRVYEPCMGKPAPDEEMATIVEATKRLLLGWWGEHRDTVRAMLAASPTPPAEQQAQPDECFPGEPKVAVPQGLIGAACSAIRNKSGGGKVLEQLRRYSVGDRSQPLAPQQAAPKAAPGEPPGIQALMCVISSLHSLRDTAHFSDEEGELTNDLCTLRDWAYAQTAAFQPSPKAAPGELSADSLRHQNKLLAETLGACILASGIVRKDIDGFTGPELLHFGEDLRSMLEVAPQQEAQEPALFVSAKQLAALTDPDDPDGEHGRYLPVRKTTKGLFTQALYTAPQPAPAPLSEMPYEKRKAIQEGEQISASDAWFKARHEMLDTVDRRNVFRAGFDRGWSAALAAQGGKA